MKVLKREFYNNGHGCSCCRKDWEETFWIDENEIPTIEEFFTKHLETFDLNASKGGLVGVCYENNGKILFGLKPQINTADWNFDAVWGDCEYPTRIEKVKERCRDDKEIYYIKYHSEEIIKKYKEEYSNGLGEYLNA